MGETGREPVRVRFAPSPTGRTHLGSGRTALYDYLLARQTGGRFILRIEDTDRKRYVPGAEQELMESLRWLGLQWDEGPDVGGPYGPYRQTERAEIYREHARRLVERGAAYPCFCTAERLEAMRKEAEAHKLPRLYDGTCRRLDPQEASRRVAAGERHVVRFRMPREGAITVRDRVRGPITVENRQLDDYVIVKSDGLALYHLAAMVDDQLMKITHVIRGAEWLPTFPLHVHIIRALGWKEPEFVHLSLFLKPSGKGKMSKRDAAALAKDGYSIYLADLRDLGYTPEGVVNWVALMGWSLDDRTENFTLADLVRSFSLERLNPAPAAINYTKLDHFNGLHIRALPDAELARRVRPFLEKAGLAVDEGRLLKVAPLVRERLVTLDDVVGMAGFFFRGDVAADAAALVAKNLTAAQAASVAARCLAVLEGLPSVEHAIAEPPLRALVEELGLSPGQVFGILRVAVTGQSVSPPLFESMAVIGRDTVLARVRRAVQALEAASAS
ncbi:MAG TPA: glutamate--tRNA ligase [bacterium]